MTQKIKKVQFEIEVERWVWVLSFITLIVSAVFTALELNPTLMLMIVFLMWMANIKIIRSSNDTKG